MQLQKQEMNEMVSNLKKRVEQMESFHADLSVSIDNISSSYETSYKDMENEFDKLLKSLENKKESFLQQLLDEETKKKRKLEEQLQHVNDALVEAEQIIKDGDLALQSSNQSDFSKEMVNVKERITMSPAFRISLTSEVSDVTCWLAVDFSRQQHIIDKLDFLTAPSKPEFCEELCDTFDNKFYCEWKMPFNEDEEEELQEGRGAQVYNLQFRQVDTNQTNQTTPWKTVSGLTDNHCLIEDLLFHCKFIQIRCQARNKFIPGEYSNVLTIPTWAYSFQLDPLASHATMKLSTPYTVEWDPSQMKGVEPRSRPSSATPGGDVRSSPKRSSIQQNSSKPKDRFIGESYTILGDTPVPSDENIYFEVVPQPDSKTYAIGLTHNSLSRYEQLGRTATSWTIFVNRWIQSSIVAKHNNKMKTLDRENFPTKIAVFYNPKQHLLSFYDPKTRDCLHTFKQVKRSSSAPLVVGLSVWKGSLQVFTGLQVPTWVEKQLTTSSSMSPSTSMISTSKSQPDNNDASR